MTAYMGYDIWHLYLINLVVPAHHTVKSVFPVHGNHRHSVLIQKKKSSVSTYHFLHFIFWSILNDCSKHFCNFFCHWNYPCSGIILFPIPLLTIIVVPFSVYMPASYFGKSPWFGAITPPKNGNRNCPPWACPDNTKSIFLF